MSSPDNTCSIEWYADWLCGLITIATSAIREREGDNYSTLREFDDSLLEHFIDRATAIMVVVSIKAMREVIHNEGVEIASITNKLTFGNKDIWIDLVPLFSEIWDESTRTRDAGPGWWCNNHIIQVATEVFNSEELSHISREDALPALFPFAAHLYNVNEAFSRSSKLIY
jgi:hypothetical protein